MEQNSAAATLFISSDQEREKGDSDREIERVNKRESDRNLIG